VKKDGVWLKPLKFLGLIYEEGTLRSETRKGSSLKLDKWDMISDDVKRENILKELLRKERPKGEGPKESRTIQENWENFMKSHLKGFIMSRLYLGKWDIEEFKGRLSLSYEKGSFMDLRKSKQLSGKVWKDLELDLFNTSSFAASWMRSWLAKKRKDRLNKARPMVPGLIVWTKRQKQPKQA
jgi:hypothetical protein